MARTITTIQQEIFDSITANENLAGLTSQSKVSIYRLIVFVVAFAIWFLEMLFDKHKSEIDIALYNQKSGRLPWYRYMALKFQYGFDLLIDSDEFDNAIATTAQINASKIIKYAAVNEGDLQGIIIVKIAGETAGKLAPITAEAKTAVDAYFNEIKYAGSRINVINYLPDRLFLQLQIYRDPLVLDANGTSILNGGKPVETAINEFMKELPFNGELILAKLIDKIQQVEGVKIPHLLVALSSWIDINTNDYATPTIINVKTIPVSGYFEIENFNTISYVV